MGARRRLHSGLARAFLGALAGIAGLGVLAPAASAAPERETVRMVIRCAGSDAAVWPLRRTRPIITAGSDGGRGWSYDWRCVTLRTWEGAAVHYIWVDFDQWGGTAINLEVVSPPDARIWWAGAPRGRP